MGAPRIELGNESAVGLPRAHAPHSHRSLGKGGTTLFYGNREPMCAVVTGTINTDNFKCDYLDQELGLQ